MGNSIEDYRAAIGLFNTKKRCLYGLVNCWAESYQQIMLINLQCSALVLSLFLLQSTIPEINIVFLLYVLQFILIIGDVETHPVALFTKILTIKNCRKCKTKIKKSFTKILTIILSVKIVLTLRVKLPCPKCKILIVREMLVLSFIVSEKNRKKDGRCIDAST